MDPTESYKLDRKIDRVLGMVSCDFCVACDEPHEMTKCSGCGKMMCPKCLYLPSINSPCHCAECRPAPKASNSPRPRPNGPRARLQ